MKLEYTEDGDGVEIVTLKFLDGKIGEEKVMRQARLGRIVRRLGVDVEPSCRYEFVEGHEGGQTWDSFEPIARSCAYDVRVELEARLFVALVGDRAGDDCNTNQCGHAREAR